MGRDWHMRVESSEYETLVREHFGGRCPYCSRQLDDSNAIIEHLDGMNRQRAGLHLPGNVLVVCRRCNSEKRRDDVAGVLSLGSSGWESFLLHDGTRCDSACATCRYWAKVWPDNRERQANMRENLERVRSFRGKFPELENVLKTVRSALPSLLGKLYADCQLFAEKEIRALLDRFEKTA